MPDGPPEGTVGPLARSGACEVKRGCLRSGRPRWESFFFARQNREHVQRDYEGAAVPTQAYRGGLMARGPPKSALRDGLLRNADCTLPFAFLTRSRAWERLPNAALKRTSWASRPCFRRRRSQMLRPRWSLTLCPSAAARPFARYAHRRARCVGGSEARHCVYGAVSPHPEVHPLSAFDAILQAFKSNNAAVFISERVRNFPPELAPHLLDTLIEDLNKSKVRFCACAGGGALFCEQSPGKVAGAWSLQAIKGGPAVVTT